MVILDTPQETTNKITSTSELHCSGRIVRQPDRFMFLGETYEAISKTLESNPLSYEEAIINKDSNHWFKAMNSILESMYSNYVWELVHAPSGIKPIRQK